MKVAYNLLCQLRDVEAHLADLPFVIPASLNALTFLTTPKASLEHIVSTVNISVRNLIQNNGRTLSSRGI